MAQKRVLCDKTEMVLMVVGKKKVEAVNLRADQITNIRFEECKELKFFWLVPSERIVITSSKRGEPIVYTKMREKRYFEEYKKDMEKFAVENRITFYNNLK